MGRRYRRSDDGLVEALYELSEAAPWAGVALAAAFAGVAAYFQWFRHPGTVFEPVTGLAPLWSLLGWVAAGGFALAATKGFVGRVLRRRRRQAVLADTRSVDDLCRLSPAGFERVVADLFRRRGFRAGEVGGPGDGGVDLILRPAGGEADHLVQCKRYKARQVGVSEVREFYGAMAARRTRCEGLFVTCGRFTPDAQAFAADKPIRLIDGPELVRLLAETNPVAPAVGTMVSLPPAVAADGPFDGAPVGPTPDVGPACPVCARRMVRRTATRGPNAGGPFWGCPAYPRCRGTRPVVGTPLLV